MMHMHHPSDPVDPTTLACAGTTLRSAARAVSRGYDTALQDGDITVTQFAILRRVARAGEIPLSRLAERMVMDRTTLYRALAPMTREGWIHIEAAPSGRARLVRLAPAGVRRLSDSTGAWESAQTLLIQAFGVERWQALHAGLRDMTVLADRIATEGGSRRP
jgi:DNA-binding MarR family transcriptional regulator